MPGGGENEVSSVGGACASDGAAGGTVAGSAVSRFRMAFYPIWYQVTAGVPMRNAFVP